MFPHAYAVPVAILLVLGGALACFAGYRLLRIVLGVYGFILGALIASSIMGVSNTAGMVVAGLIGGLIGALALGLAYFAGVALVGAALATLIAHVVWGQMQTGDPPWQLIVFAAVIGALGAVILQRYVIIVSTAFSGAWTLLVGGLAIADSRSAKAASAPDAWILYPLTPAPGHNWIYAAWIAVGLVGLAVQLRISAAKKKK